VQYSVLCFVSFHMWADVYWNDVIIISIFMHGWIPRGAVAYPEGEGSNHPPHWIFEIFWLCVCTKILSKLCTYIYYILNFVQENVKYCTLIRHYCFSFWSTSWPDPLPGLCPWVVLGDPSPKPPGSTPVFDYSRYSPVNPLQCKILGTPMLWRQPSHMKMEGKCRVLIFVR